MARTVNNWGKFFGHVAMKEMVGFLTTFNMVSQTVSGDANVYDIESSGTGDCTINGVYIPSLTADAALPINTAQAAPTLEWDGLADGMSACAVDSTCYTGTLQGATQKFYKCLVAHNASYDQAPADNPNLWQATPNLDEMELADDFRLYIMITAESDGTLGAWIASAHSAIGTVPTLAVPYYDPSVYCVIALCDYANDAAAATVTFGESGGGVDFDTDGTFIDVIGPCLPAIANIPSN